jgi:hypothetical protein
MRTLEIVLDEDDRDGARFLAFPQVGRQPADEEGTTMNKIFAGVRQGDVVLAVLMTALGVLMMLENILSGSTAEVRIDSHSWLLVPVFAAATLPILWRRRSMIGVLVVTAAALAVHVLPFGWMVRCGAGLPLAFALAYGAGRLSRGVWSWIGLVGSLAVQFLVLVRDSAAGLDIIPVTAAIGVAAWGVGVLLARRAERSAELETPVPAPAQV